MKIIQRELIIFISTLIFCYISYKLNCYNVIILYLLVRLWIENKLGE